SPQPAMAFELPNSLELIITIASVIFAVGIIVYAIATVPRAIGRSGQKITRASATAVLPHFSQHRQMSKKQQRRLLEYITWSVKVILVLLPILLLVIPPSYGLGLSHTVVAITGVVFGMISLLLFLLQYLLARHWR